MLRPETRIEVLGHYEGTFLFEKLSCQDNEPMNVP